MLEQNKNLFKFNLTEPQPNYIDNYEVVDNSRRFVKFGVDNNIPQFISSLINRSPIHGAIIDRKIKLVSGKKIVIDGLPNLFINNNPKLIKELKKAINDFVIFDTFALKIIPSLNGIGKIEHIDITKVRLGIRDEDDKINSVFISNNWEKVRLKENKITEYPIYEEGIKQESVFIFEKYEPGKRYYSLPTYAAAIDGILTDEQISKLHLNQLLNGLFPSTLLKINKVFPTIEEKIRYVRDVERNYKGALSAGEAMIVFTEGNVDDFKIEPINSNDSGEKFLSLSEKVIQDILSAHNVSSPQLFGIRVPGSLGGSQELSDASDLFFTNYVYPKQNEFIESIEELLSVFGEVKVSIEQEQLFKNKLSEATLTQILSVEELRQIAGYENNKQENLITE